jgi:hypothetical protein
MCESVGTLQRSLTGRDSQQGVTQTWFNVLCNFPISAQQSGASRMAFYAQMSASIGTTFYTPDNIGAQANDRLKVTDRTGTITYYNVDGITQSVGRGRLYTTQGTAIAEPQGEVTDAAQ